MKVISHSLRSTNRTESSSYRNKHATASIQRRWMWTEFRAGPLS